MKQLLQKIEIIIIPEKWDNSYQNISLSMYESSHGNDICCKGHLIVNVFKKSKKILCQIISHCNALFPFKEEKLHTIV